MTESGEGSDCLAESIVANYAGLEHLHADVDAKIDTPGLVDCEMGIAIDNRLEKTPLVEQVSGG